MKLSKIHERTEIFFYQKLHDLARRPNLHRNEYIKNAVSNKIVLHVGCVDWPVTDINENLHKILAGIARSIDGCDLPGRGLEQLKEECPGVYFEGIESVLESENSYEFVLAPEVVEHVPNAGDFLEKLFFRAGPRVPDHDPQRHPLVEFALAGRDDADRIFTFRPRRTLFAVYAVECVPAASR